MFRLSSDQSGANMSGSMSEDDKSFTVSGYSEWEGRNVSATYLRYWVGPTVSS